MLAAEGRLVTLTGPGGCGKTRLAVQLGRDLVDAFADGVWQVELAPLADPSLIPQAVATALGVAEQPGRSMLDTLVASLQGCQLRLVTISPTLRGPSLPSCVSHAAVIFARRPGGNWKTTRPSGVAVPSGRDLLSGCYRTRPAHAGATKGARRMSTEDNKALVRRWFEETDRGNDGIIDQLCAPDYVDHSPPLPSMGSGSAAVRQANAALRVAFADTVHTVEDQIAEGDKVVTRLTAYGTHQRDLPGIPATGRQLTMTGTAIHRIENGKIAEKWSDKDALGFLRQLGALPAP
jgi:steroid delta-isomerase-like uncharacterized protein